MDSFKEYGPQSSVYQTRVLGDFPEEANDTLIPLRDVEAAVKRPHVVQPDDKPIIGVDIARFGDDKTVIIVREGIRVRHIEELRKSDLVNTTGRVITVAKEFKAKHIIVDEVGIGAGVLDTLKKDRTYLTTGLNGGARADDAEKYGNLRAQIFDGLRQRFADGDISIPNDPELISQVAALTYRYNAVASYYSNPKTSSNHTGCKAPTKPTHSLTPSPSTKPPSIARESRYTTQKPSPLKREQRRNEKYRY